jgi:hypothetical protein
VPTGDVLPPPIALWGRSDEQQSPPPIPADLQRELRSQRAIFPTVTTIVLAAGGVQGAGWFAVCLVVTAVQLAFQVRASMRGDDDPGWPLIGAQTTAGRVAAIVPSAALSLFFLVALLTS